MAIQFHALAFEGPDPYSRAGGIASRIAGLTEAIGRAGFGSHLWFVGDPRLPAQESRRGVELHRWCQWISAHHPIGVYDGEEGKLRDFSRSLPQALCERVLEPLVAQGDLAVVLAEEWHTVEAVLNLHDVLSEKGLRHRVCILWNANNVFGFDRIDWRRLSRAATITTVSRYMKHRMAALGIEAAVVPNGVEEDAFELPDLSAIARFRAQTEGRLVLAKMARFDPDKRWIAAVEISAELKRRRLRPLLVARGGLEAHGAEVLERASQLGLCVSRRALTAPGVDGLVDGLSGLEDIDLVVLETHVDAPARRVLFNQAGAVLANSGHEPFGLVGLETMAVAGLAITGCSGEDYADSGRNALVVQGADPAEFVSSWMGLQRDPRRELRMRREGRVTARRYLWSEILRLHLLPRIEIVGGPAFAAALATRSSVLRPRLPSVRSTRCAAARPIPPVLPRRLLVRAEAADRRGRPALFQGAAGAEGGTISTSSASSSR